jgi:hypothetical protein
VQGAAAGNRDGRDLRRRRRAASDARGSFDHAGSRVESRTRCAGELREQQLPGDRFTGPHTPGAAQGKAYTAVTFKLDTLALARTSLPGGASAGIEHLPGVVTIGGGIPIESAGSIVGAIGVSGAPGGEADDACAKAGIAAIRDELDF